MDESKEEMPSTYDVYYKAHDATISKWFAAERLSTHCGDDTQNEKGLKQCSAVHRIAIVMACATHDMQRTFETFFQKESADTDRIYSVTAFMDDYHHIIKDHDDELENLRYFLIDEYDSECSQQCDYLTRNYRNKSEWSNDREMELYHTNDNKVVLINRQIDKIHAYLFHSFELNYRLTEKEALQIFGTKTEQKDDKKYDDEEEEDMDHEGQQKTQQIGQMMKVIECKRTKMRVLVGDARMTNNKFVTNVVSDQKTDPASTDEHSDEKEQRKEVSATEYSFGFPFKYYTRFKHGKWFICKKHSDMKDELLNNPFQTLSLAQYQHQYEESNVFLECAAIRRLKCEHIPLYDEPQAIDTGLSPKSPITAPHIMSLLFYCNFTELCTVFSSTFRRIAQNETDEGVKERNAHFFHWSKLLLESIHLFGTPLTTGGILSKFTVYHGVSCIMVFNNMNQGVYGPFSTTAQFNVALQFADSGKTGGLVLTLGRSSSIKHNKYFDCGLISNFTAESEKLFLNGLVQIHDIVHVKSKQSFGWYCRALTVLTSMLNATPLNSRIARKIHAKFYAAMMDGGAKYPKYAQALWKHTVNSIKSVDIDLQLMNVIEADTAEENIKQFLVKHTQSLTKMKECKKWGFKLLNSFVMLPNGWINLERLCQLLPNLEVVRIERYKRGNLDITNDKLVESITLNEELIDRFLEYEPPVPIAIIIDKPNESEMSMSSFIGKCRETQKGKINKRFVIEAGTINTDLNLKCLFVCFGDTPLHQACTHGEDEVVLELLKSDDKAVKESINHPARYTKATPLVVAVDQGHVKCVQHMLSIDEVLINAPDRYNNNAFMMAVAHRDNDIAMMLLDHSDKMEKKGIQHGIVDVNHVDDGGNSALHDAAVNNNHEMIDALIQRNIDTDLQNSRHETALHIACDKQHTQTLEILLKNGKANPNLESVLGQTPLMHAINNRYTQGIELLLKYGADANKTNEHDDDNACATAMYYAIKKKTKKTVSLLLDAGADPTKIDANQQTYLHVVAEEAQDETLGMLFEAVSARMSKEEMTAFVNQQDTDGDTALHIAAGDDDRKNCVQYLLQNTPCDVNMLNKRGRSALSTALHGDYAQIAQMLLAAGSKTDIIDKSCQTLLFAAVGQGNLDLTKAVYENYMKNSNVEEARRFVNHVDGEGKTALHAACDTNLGKVSECVEYLIGVGANVDVYDANGGSLLHAIARGWAGRDVMEAIYDAIDWTWDRDRIDAFVNHADNEHETALFACANDIKLAKYLLSIGGKIDPQCDIDKVNKYKDTALANAASEGCLELVNILLDAGAKIDTFNWQNETPLYQAAEKPAIDILKAIYNRYLQNTDNAAATKFVNHENDDKETALFAAARVSNGTDCVEFLLSVGAEVCLFNEKGETPFIKASGFGEPESLKCLYNHYLATTDLATATRLVNHKAKNKQNALFAAAEHGYIGVIEFLLSVGATASASDIDCEGNSVLHVAAQGKSVGAIKALYENIVQNTNEKCAQDLLNSRNQNGETVVLVVAGYRRPKDVVEYLLGVGAAVNVVDGVKGKSVLHLDAHRDDIEMLKMVYESYLKDTNLLEATKLVNAQDFGKETVLHLAVDSKCTDKVKYLLENTNCDVNLENNNSETPLMIAAKKGCTQILKLLLNADGVKLVDNHGNCDALRLAKRKKKECADVIEESLMQRLSADEATKIIQKYPDNYPEEDDDDDCLIM
eukprot:116725_1